MNANVLQGDIEMQAWLAAVHVMVNWDTYVDRSFASLTGAFYDSVETKVAKRILKTAIKDFRHTMADDLASPNETLAIANEVIDAASHVGGPVRPHSVTPKVMRSMPFNRGQLPLMGLNRAPRRFTRRRSYGRRRPYRRRTYRPRRRTYRRRTYRRRRY